MIDYKKNFMFALGVMGLITYFFVPGFFKTGDFLKIVNSAGNWYFYGILALVCQGVFNVVDGISGSKGPRTMATEIFFVVPLCYVFAILVLCGALKIWNSSEKGVGDYKTHAQAVMDKRYNHEVAEGGGNP